MTRKQKKRSLEDILNISKVEIIREQDNKILIRYEGVVEDISKSDESCFYVSNGYASSFSMSQSLRMIQQLEAPDGIFHDTSIPKEFQEAIMFHEIREREYTNAGFDDAHERAVNDELLYAIKFFSDKLEDYVKFSEDYRFQKVGAKQLIKDFVKNKLKDNVSSIDEMMIGFPTIDKVYIARTENKEKEIAFTINGELLGNYVNTIGNFFIVTEDKGRLDIKTASGEVLLKDADSMIETTPYYIDQAFVKAKYKIIIDKGFSAGERFSKEIFEKTYGRVDLNSECNRYSLIDRIYSSLSLVSDFKFHEMLKRFGEGLNEDIDKKHESWYKAEMVNRSFDNSKRLIMLNPNINYDKLNQEILDKYTKELCLDRPIINGLDDFINSNIMKKTISDNAKKLYSFLESSLELELHKNGFSEKSIDKYNKAINLMDTLQKDNNLEVEKNETNYVVYSAFLNYLDKKTSKELSKIQAQMNNKESDYSKLISLLSMTDSEKSDYERSHITCKLIDGKFGEYSKQLIKNNPELIHEDNKQYFSNTFFKTAPRLGDTIEQRINALKNDYKVPDDIIANSWLGYVSRMIEEHGRCNLHPAMNNLNKIKRSGLLSDNDFSKRINEFMKGYITNGDFRTPSYIALHVLENFNLAKNYGDEYIKLETLNKGAAGLHNFKYKFME